MILAALLGLALLVGVPVQALARRKARGQDRSRTVRYLRTITEAGVLGTAAGLIAWQRGLQPANFGLEWPPGQAGQFGLLIAAALVGGLLAAVLLLKPTSAALRDEKGDAIMPRTAAELRLFLLLTLVIGFAWELLYRAYLLWWLEPLVGVPAAVLLASAAYALAHGWEGWRPVLGSLVSALLFTIGYALTRSLWWLAAIHIALPLVGLLAFRRVQAAVLNKEPARA